MIDTLMSILAIYSSLVKKGLLQDSKGIMPPEQQKAIDDFARMNNCEIFWDEEYETYLWTRREE